jgi:WD40 repeat protein
MSKTMFPRPCLDNTRVASGSDDRTIKIWDAYTGACLQTLKRHCSQVSSVNFSHDSSCVASGSYDKTIKIWAAHTGACLQTLEGHDSRVRLVVFSHDSSCIASGSYDHTIKIWDVQTGTCLQTLGIGSTVQNLSFDATGSALHTNNGVFAFCDLSRPTPTTPTEVTASKLQIPSASQQLEILEYQGYSISSDKSWITRRSPN